MSLLTRFALTGGIACGLCALPTIASAQQTQDAAVQEAIRFEKAKEAAAQRQMQIDAGQEPETTSTAKAKTTVTKKPPRVTSATLRTPRPQR